MKEINVRKPMVVFILQRSDELRLYIHPGSELDSFIPTLIESGIFKCIPWLITGMFFGGND
jgi:hypothetical protein